MFLKDLEADGGELECFVELALARASAVANLVSLLGLGAVFLTSSLRSGDFKGDIDLVTGLLATGVTCTWSENETDLLVFVFS
jgi:hypothetical protein